MKSRIGAILGLLLCALPVAGEEVMAYVSHVDGGDSLRVRTDAGEAIRVRMLGIDAPEKDQPWGKESRDALARQIKHKRVRVGLTDKTLHGRKVGKVYRPDGTEINYWMVDRGYAWEYDEFNERLKLKAAERLAMLAERGIWSQPAPIPPWKWRQGVRKGSEEDRAQIRDLGDALAAVAEYFGLTPEYLGEGLVSMAHALAEFFRELGDATKGRRT